MAQTACLAMAAVSRSPVDEELLLGRQSVLQWLAGPRMACKAFKGNLSTCKVHPHSSPHEHFRSQVESAFRCTRTWPSSFPLPRCVLVRSRHFPM